MSYEHMLLQAIFVPLLGAFVVPVLPARLRNLLSLLFVASSCVFSLMLIAPVLSGRTIIVAKELAIGVNFIFVADRLAVFMACVSSFISAIIVLYSFDYISHYKHQNEYYSMVVLFLGAMMGLVFSGNLIVLYIFWEITAITSWRLIGFFREPAHVVRADKAFLVTVFGAFLMLIGFISIYQQAGSFDLTVIKESLKSNPLPNLAVVLILAGILSKSATLPFHTWLPDAGVAPSPVTALLHAAVLVKVGVYVYARLFVSTFAISRSMQLAVMVIAGISALVSAGAALRETDLKRLIAFSTVSQIGFIFLGLSTGNAIGVAGGLLYILMHGLAKGGLFLCAGIVEQSAKTKDITRMGGLIATMPFTAFAFLFCAFSVMGIPPFGGFLSKYMVFGGAIQNGNYFIAGMFLLGAFMTILYLFRAFTMVFLGPLKGPLAKEGSIVMVSSVVLLAVFSLAGGILVQFPLFFARGTAGQMLGMFK